MIVKNHNKINRCGICGKVLDSDYKFQAFNHFYCLSCYHHKVKCVLLYWKAVEKGFKGYEKHLILENL